MIPRTHFQRVHYEGARDCQMGSGCYRRQLFTHWRLCLLQCPRKYYEANEDSPFLVSGLIEHAWEFWASRRGLGFMHLGLHLKAANNVRSTLFPP